ncbi:hypothetical protein [Marinifilum sp.]|uniref:hypothetical protein n=1 Tax=Marinifilum sp. TaxID=2033137 RepID=UPI003BA90F50
MRKLVLLSLLISSFKVFGTTENRPAGARSFAMGNAFVAVYDEWSGFHNPAALALLTKKSFGAYYENRFSNKELSSKSLHVNIPGKLGTFAGVYTQYGFDLYKESKLGIAYAKALGKNFWAGLLFNQLKKELKAEYGSQSKYTFEIGLLAKISPNFYLGFQVSNPTQERFQTWDYDDKISTTGSLGFSWVLSNGSIISSEVFKDIDQDLQIKTGIEYPVNKKLFLRAGFYNHPNSASMGFGFSFPHFKANIAFARHPVLGYTPSADLSFQF